MFIESVGSSLLIAKLRGGKFKNLLDFTIHKWWILLAAGSIETLTSLIRRTEFEPLWRWVDQYGMGLQLLCYLLLIWVIIENRKSKGFLWILLGVLLNFIVIMANGGRMPVDIQPIDENLFHQSLEILKSGKDLTHAVLNENTRFKFLGDIIYLKKPYPWPKSLSVGDLFMIAGVFSFIQGLALGKLKE